MSPAVAENFLDEKTRAEDIILGSLGFGEDAMIVSIVRTPDGFKGSGKWADGDTFIFENDDPVDSLQEWALSVLVKA